MDAGFSEREPISTVPAWHKAVEAVLFDGEAGNDTEMRIRRLLAERAFDPRSIVPLEEPADFPQKQETALSIDYSDIDPNESNLQLETLLRRIRKLSSKQNVKSDLQPDRPRARYSPTPVLARWTLPVFLEKGYVIVSSFDMKALSAANEAAGMRGGDIALRRIEKVINDSLGVTNTFNKGDAGEHMLVCMGGDEYVIISKEQRLKEETTSEKINTWLQNELAPFIIFEPESTDAYRSEHGMMPGGQMPKSIKWKPLEVAEKEIPDVPQSSIAATEYSSSYKALFHLTEDEFHQLDEHTKQLLCESVLDPVFGQLGMVKNPMDCRIIQEHKNEGAPQIAVAVSFMGLKEANERGVGDQFLREAYNFVHQTLTDVLRIEEDAYTISRNRGSTFIIMINSEKSGVNSIRNSQESLVSAIIDNITTALKRKGNMIADQLTFPGFSYEREFEATNEAVIKLVDRASVWEVLQLAHILEQFIEEEQTYIDEHKTLEGFVSTVNPEQLQFAQNYLQQGARKFTRRRTLAKAVATAINFFSAFGVDDRIAKIVRSYSRVNSRYGDSDIGRAGEEAMDLFPIQMIGTLFGITLSKDQLRKYESSKRKRRRKKHS